MTASCAHAYFGINGALAEENGLLLSSGTSIALLAAWGLQGAGACASTSPSRPTARGDDRIAIGTDGEGAIHIASILVELDCLPRVLRGLADRRAIHDAVGSWGASGPARSLHR